MRDRRRRQPREAERPRFLQQGIDALRTGGFRQVQISILLLLAVAVLGGVARYGMRELLNTG
ncbi:MAG TPA: hypothetical protein VFZ87_03670, partial [Gemmatimonadales bacterium]